MTQRLCTVSEVGAKGKEIRVTARENPPFVMLFRVDDEIVAYHNTCPHQGLSLNWAPDRFLVGDDDGLLVCAHHGAAFELSSGKCVQGPCKGSSLQPIDIFIKDDEVWLGG
ncbi:MAG: Rieske 2Fe-2S domain-containing protein [Xanthomonadales bacterium]